MIIGVAGPLAVGKDTVADILVKKGFVNYSYGDILRAECDKRGLPKDIPTLVRIADELRAKDPGILTKMILEKIKIQKTKNAVLSGIRAPAEVDVLKNDPDFILIWLDAPIELRYARIQAAKRDERDNLTFEEFKKREHQQMNGINTQINLSRIRDQADIKLRNDGDIQSLSANIEELIWKNGEISGMTRQKECSHHSR